MENKSIKRTGKKRILSIIRILAIFLIVSCSSVERSCGILDCPTKNCDLKQGDLIEYGKVIGANTFHSKLAGKVSIKEFGSRYYFWTKNYTAACCSSIPKEVQGNLGEVDVVSKCRNITAGHFWFEGLGLWTEYTLKYEEYPSTAQIDEYYTTYLETMIFDEDGLDGWSHFEFQIPEAYDFFWHFLQPLGDSRYDDMWDFAKNGKGAVITTICGGGIKHEAGDENLCCSNTGYIGDYYHGLDDCKAQLISSEGKSGNLGGPYYGFFRAGDACCRIPTINKDHQYTTSQNDGYNWVADGAAFFYRVPAGRYLMKVWNKDNKDDYFRPLYLKVATGKITNACPPNGAQLLGPNRIKTIRIIGLNQPGSWETIPASGVPLAAFGSSGDNKTNLYREVVTNERFCLTGDVRSIDENGITLMFFNHGHFYDGGNSRKLYSVRLKREGLDIIVMDTNGRRETIAGYAANDIAFQDVNGDGVDDNNMFLEFFHNGENYINEDDPNVEPIVLIRWNGVTINDEYN